MTLSPNTWLGAYEIVAPLGSGGMGDVYRARDTVLGRDVAVKVLPTVSPERLRRFEQEARAVSSLNHPNIVTIHAVGEADGTRYIVTEYVAGETIRERLDRGPMPLAAALDIAIQTAEALEAAHDAGIVHRDVKPANLMVRPDGYVKVLDFGLAKLLDEGRAAEAEASAETDTAPLTHAGLVVGTLNYMSPEQVRGLQVDARTDIFSLGVVLYEMVTGRRPFDARTLADRIVALLERDLTPISTSIAGIPPELERIVAKALKKDPEERYQGVKDLLVDLRAVRQELVFQERLESLPRGVARQQPRTGLIRPAITVAAGVGVLALALAGLLWWRTGHHTASPEALRWYQVGTAALRDGAYHQASKALERAVEIDRRFALAYARLAESYAELDYADRAKDALLVVSRLVPDRSSLPVAERNYLEAVSATVTRDFAAAVAAYREALAASAEPEKPQVYVDLGRAYEKNEDVDHALESFLEASRRDPHYATPLLRAGGLHGRRQEADKALAAFARAEEIYRLQGNFEGRAETLYLRGAMFLKQQNKLADARAQFEAAGELARASGNESQQVRALIQLSDIFFDEGSTDRAETSAREAIRIAGERGLENLVTRGTIKLGDRFFQRGDYATAETHYRSALQQARRNKAAYSTAQSLFMLGSLDVQRRNLAEATAALEQALAFYKAGGYRQEVMLGLTLLARANRFKGNYEAALAALDEQMPLAEKTGSGMALVLLHSDSGRVLEELGRYPEALDRFDKSYSASQSIKIDLEMSRSLTSRGRLLGHLGRFEEARQAFNRAASIASPPEKYASLRSYLYLSEAEVALFQEKHGAAAALARKALKIPGSQKPAEIQGRRLLGLALVRLGRRAEGLAQCDQALELARGAGDAGLLAKAELSAAEARLETGDAAGALAPARDVADKLARSKQIELAWRAALAAARASRLSRDLAQMREHAARADRLLNEIAQRWGAHAYRTYMARPDVARGAQELQRMLAAKS